MRILETRCAVACMAAIFSAASLAAGQGDGFIGAATTKVAPRWEEGMLTGNGNMGGIALGNPYSETLYMTQQEGFLPRHSLPKVPRIASRMPELKKMALEAGNGGPALFTSKVKEIAGVNQSFGYDTFHPAFFLKISMEPDTAEDYLLTQNFENGEVVAKWSDSRGPWRRSFFISRPDDVAVVRIEGPKGKVSCDLSMLIQDEAVRTVFDSKDGFITAHTTYVMGKGGYDSVVRIVAGSGTVTHTEAGAAIRNADEILLVMQIRHWRTPLPAETCDAWAFSPDNPYYQSKDYKTNYIADMMSELSALPADYRELLEPHAKIHGELFSRVKIDLGGTEADRKKTSQQLMAEPFSMALLERAYHACRYLMICSNGKHPPHLQGIWNGAWKPLWGCGYHLDSNLQLCIQGNLSCNMPELMEGYFDLIERILPDCRLNAREFFNCRGAVSRSGVVSSDALMNKVQRFPGELYYSCLGWLAHFFYDYYQFTGDKEFLKNRAVPLLKEVALFYRDLLEGTEGADGKYRFFISVSPENPPNWINSTYDISIAKAMHQYLIDACEELGIEGDSIATWKEFISKLPEYRINSKGELQEWAVEGATEIFNHRHHSAFLPVYQFCEFDPEKTPELWEASERAFEGKIREWFRNHENPNSWHITHGMVNQGQCAARLGRGDIVHEVMERLMTQGYMLPNFMMHYWPKKTKQCFGMDPIGTIPDVINNALLFMWGGTLDVLPALPEPWSDGSISGILLRDQIKADECAWKDSGRHVKLSMTSRRAQDITIRFPADRRIASVKVVKGAATARSIAGRAHCYRLTLPENEPVRLDIATEVLKPGVSSLRKHDTAGIED